MEPATGLAVLGGAIGSAKVLEKLLGPTAEYLGEGFKDWTAKGLENLGRIFESANARLGNRIDEPGGIPPRVLKEVLRDGPFCEDELWAEYFGGVLASSRSDVPRDDRGARFASMIGRLSTYQVRGHFVFYRLIKTLFDESEHLVTTDAGRRALRIFLPAGSFAASMDLTESEPLDTIMSHTVVGLVSENLLGDWYHFGDAAYLQKSGFKEANETGLLVQPSHLGTELFLWAHGMGDTLPSEFLHKETAIVSHIQVNVTRGVRSTNEAGPFLNDVLKLG